MGGFKMTEILLVLLVIMVLFGASRLPQLGSSLGSAIRNFKRGFGGEDETKDDAKLTASSETTASAPAKKDSEKA